MAAAMQERLRDLVGTAVHEPVDHNGRTVCACGDFNCASLDALTGGAR